MSDLMHFLVVNRSMRDAQREAEEESAFVYALQQQRKLERSKTDRINAAKKRQSKPRNEKKFALKDCLKLTSSKKAPKRLDAN